MKTASLVPSGVSRGANYHSFATTTGGGGRKNCLVRAAIRVGIPVVDTTSVSSKRVTKLLRCPPFTSEDPARRAVYIKCAKRLGAKVIGTRYRR